MDEKTFVLQQDSTKNFLSRQLLPIERRKNFLFEAIKFVERANKISYLLLPPAVGVSS
jgi:hypothetical protein